MPPRTPAHLAPLALAALAPLLLTGCGSSSQPAATVTVTATLPPASGAPTGASTTSTSSTPATSTAGSAGPTSRVASSPASTLRPGAPASSAPRPTSTPAANKPACGTDSATAAGRKAAATLSTDPVTKVPWSTSAMTTENYDPCSPLSWIELTTNDRGRFEPRRVALFHFGRLVGPAGPSDMSAVVKRVSDRAVRVSWTSPRDSSEVKPYTWTLTTASVFSWDDASGRVIRTGTLPPSPR